MTETRVAVVTGAGRGIGAAVAAAPARAGFDLLLAARTGTALETLASRLSGETGRRAEIAPRDLRDPDAAGRVVRAALDAFGRIDLLVNNAGATRRGAFLELGEADWQDGYALKLFGCVRMCRAAWPALRATGGQVVDVIGGGGRTPTAEFAIGGSVNAALMNLTEALADLGLQDGVRVNGISPGPIRTERLETRIRALAAERGIAAEEAAARLVDEQRVVRFGGPEEIAAVVAFLAAGGGTYLHGALLDVDGGATKGL